MALSAYSAFNETTNSTRDKLSMTGILHTCHTVNFIMYTIFVGICCVLGLVGNTISIVVFRRDRRSCAYTFLLQALAFADNMVLLISWPLLVIIIGLLPFIKGSDVEFLTVRHYYWVYINPIAYMAYTQSVLVTCLLAITRYIAVCKIFAAATLCTLKKVRIQVAIVTTISIVLNFPRFFQRRMVNNMNGTSVEQTAIGGESLFGIIYTTIYSVLICVIPIALLAFLNVKLVIALRTARHTRRRLSADSQDLTESRTNEDNITKVMIIVILVFLLCNTPYRLQQVFLMVFKVKPDCREVLVTTHAICNLLLIINSSNNFIIYYMYKTSFRTMVLQMCTNKLSQEHKNVVPPDTLPGRKKSSLVHEQLFVSSV